MGTSPRPRPERLAEKLLRIRLGLGLSQSQMFRLLEDPGIRLHATHLSRFESGQREPPLQILLHYARAARIPVEILIDDERDLPKRLASGHSVWVLKDGRLWERKTDR